MPVAVGFALVAALATPLASAGDGAPVLAVPQDYATVQDAVDASEPGDLILVDRGTYPGGVVVPEERPDITIRGVDRNQVVFDGRGQVGVAIEVEADGVTLENLTAHDYDDHGFYWRASTGSRGGT